MGVDRHTDVSSTNYSISKNNLKNNKEKPKYFSLESCFFMAAVLIFAIFVAYPFQSAAATNPYIEFCWDQTIGFFSFLIDIAKGLSWLFGPWLIVLAVVVAFGLGIIFSLTCPPNLVAPPMDTTMIFLECNAPRTWVATGTPKILEQSTQQDGNPFLIVGKFSSSLEYDFQQGGTSFNRKEVLPDVQIVNGFIPFMMIILSGFLADLIGGIPGLKQLAKVVLNLIVGILFGVFDYKFFFSIDPNVRGDGHITHPTTSIRSITANSDFKNFNLGFNKVTFEGKARNFGTTDTDAVYVNVVDTFLPIIEFDKKVVILEANSHFGWTKDAESTNELGGVRVIDTCNPDLIPTYLGQNFYPLTEIAGPQRTYWTASDKSYQIVPPSPEEMEKVLAAANTDTVNTLASIKFPCNEYETFVQDDRVPHIGNFTKLTEMVIANSPETQATPVFRSDCMKILGIGGGNPPTGVIKASIRWLVMDQIITTDRIEALIDAFRINGLKSEKILNNQDVFQAKTFKKTFQGIKRELAFDASEAGQAVKDFDNARTLKMFQASDDIGKAKIKGKELGKAFTKGKIGSQVLKKAFGAGFGAAFIATTSAIFPPDKVVPISAPIFEGDGEQRIFVVDTIPPDIFIPRHHAQEVDVNSKGCKDVDGQIMCEVEVLPPLVFDVADPFPRIEQNFTANGVFEELDKDSLIDDFPVGKTTVIKWRAIDFSRNTSDEVELFVTIKEFDSNEISEALPQTVTGAFASTSTEITVQATNPDQDPLQFKIVQNPSDGIIESPIDAVFQNKFQKEGTIALLKGIAAGVGDDKDTVYFTDSANKRVLKTDPGMMLETIFSTTGSSDRPEAIARTPTGDFVISDWDNDDNDFILQVSDGGNLAIVKEKFNVTGIFEEPKNISVDAESPNDIYITDITNKTVSKLSHFDIFGSPLGLATLDSNLFVANFDHEDQYRISKFDSDDMFVEKFGSTGDNDGEFDTPNGITLNSTRIFVADTNNNRIQIFDEDGEFILRMGASDGDGTAGDEDGEFDKPSGIAVNQTHIFVADTNNNRIQIFNETRDGIFKIGAANGDGTAGDKDGEFDKPKAIASNGTYSFVADTGNHRIQIFNETGDHYLTFGTFGESSGQLDQPSGIAVNKTHILVSDTNNHRLQLFDHFGNSEQIIGSMGNLPGQFLMPTGIAFDESGNIYVSDTNNKRIQKLNSNGIFLNEIKSSINSKYDGYLNKILLSIPNLHADAIEYFPPDIFFIGDWTLQNKKIFKLNTGGGNIVEFDIENLVGDPKNIAVNNDGDIFITDKENDKIVILNDSGELIDTFMLDFTPEGISADGNNIIVSNWNNEEIITLDSSGAKVGNPFNVTTIFSDPKDIATNSTDYFVTENATSQTKIVKIRKDKGIVNQFDVPAGPPEDQRGFAFGKGLEKDIIFFANASENKILNVDTSTLPIQISDLLDLAPSNIRPDDIAVNPMLADFAVRFANNTDGDLAGPTGLAFGPDGNLYVASSLTPAIKRFDGSDGDSMGDFIDDFILDPRLRTPRDIVFHNDDLYIANFDGNNILRYDGITGDFIEVFASGSTLSGPSGLTFGPDGNLFVSNSAFENILNFSGQDGKFNGEFVKSNDSQLNLPQGLKFGPNGDLYVSSFSTNDIQVYDGTTGEFKRKSAQDEDLKGPIGLVFGPENGSLFVISSENDQILEYESDELNKVGIFSDQEADLPNYLTFGEDSRLYVTSYASNEILRYGDEPVKFYIADWEQNRIIGIEEDGSTVLGVNYPVAVAEPEDGFEPKYIDTNSKGDIWISFSNGTDGILQKIDRKNGMELQTISLTDIPLESAVEMTSVMTGDGTEGMLDPDDGSFMTEEIEIETISIIPGGISTIENLIFVSDWENNRIVSIFDEGFVGKIYNINGTLDDPRDIAVQDSELTDSEEIKIWNISVSDATTDTITTIRSDRVIKEFAIPDTDSLNGLTMNIELNSLFFTNPPDGTVFEFNETAFILPVTDIFVEPEGISVPSSNSIYVSDWKDERILKLDSSGKRTEDPFDLSPAMFLAKEKLRDIEVDEGRNLVWVSDSRRGEITSVDLATGGIKSDPGIFKIANKFVFGSGLAIDSKDNFIFASTKNNTLIKFDERARKITDKEIVSELVVQSLPSFISPSEIPYGVGETIYEDVDKSDRVSPGDIRRANADAVEFLDGSTVTAGDVDDGRLLISLSPKIKFADTNFNVKFEGTSAISESVYKDMDNSGTISPGDIRLVNSDTVVRQIFTLIFGVDPLPPGFNIDGSTVLSNLPDIFAPQFGLSPLTAFSSDFKHTVNYDISLPDIWSSFDPALDADFSYLISHVDTGEMNPNFGVLSKLDTDLVEIVSLTVEFEPNAIAADVNGNVYVSSGGDTIKKFNKDLDEIPIGTLTAPGAMISDITIDSEGNLFASDTAQHRIHKFDASGNPVGWLGKCDGPSMDSMCDRNDERSRGFMCTDSLCTNSGVTSGSGYSQFHTPIAITVDGTGNLFVADTQIKLNGINSPRIQKFSNDGVYIENTVSNVTKSKIKGNFISPHSIVSSSNFFYVLDEKKLHVFDTNPFSPFRLDRVTNITSSDVSYRANFDFVPVDSFSFKVFDGFDESEPAIITVNIGDSDLDNDGLFADVDQSDERSDFFEDDSKSGRITNGTIFRGEQDVIILDSRDKAKGVTIQADIEPLGDMPARIEACEGDVEFTMKEGNKVELTCDPVTIEVIRGNIDALFFDDFGRTGQTTIQIENSLTFDSKDFSFTAGNENFQMIDVEVWFNGKHKTYQINPAKFVKIDTAGPDIASVCPKAMSLESEIVAGVEMDSKKYQDILDEFFGFEIPDVDDGIPQLASTDPYFATSNSPDIFPYNVTTTIDFSVIDEIGNISECSSAINAKDSTPPTITYPFPDDLLEATTSIYNDAVPLYFGEGSTFDPLFATARDLPVSVDDELGKIISDLNHPVNCYLPQSAYVPVGQSSVICTIADMWPIIGSKGFRVEIFANDAGVVIESITASKVTIPAGSLPQDTIIVRFSQPTNTPTVDTKEDIDNILTFSKPIGIDYSGRYLNPSTLIISINDTAEDLFTSPTTASIKSKTAITSASGIIDSSTEPSPPLDGSFDEIHPPFITAFIAHDPSMVKDNDEDEGIMGNIEPSEGDLLIIKFSEPTNIPGSFGIFSKNKVDSIFDFGTKSPGSNYSGKWLDRQTFEIKITETGYFENNLLIGQHTVQVKPDAELKNQPQTSGNSVSESQPLIGSFGPFNVMKVVREGGTATTFLPSGILTQITFPRGTEAGVSIASTEISEFGGIKFLGNAIDISISEDEDPCSAPIGCEIKFTFSSSDIINHGIRTHTLKIYHDANNDGEFDSSETLDTTIIENPTDVFMATATFFSASPFGIGGTTGGGGGGDETAPTIEDVSITGVKTLLPDGSYGFGGVIAREIQFSNNLPTAIIETGEPVKLKFILEENSGIAALEHVSLYTNIRGIFKEITDSDTFLRYNKGVPNIIKDPNSFMSEADISVTPRESKIDVTFDVTFEKPMEISDVIIRAWDTSRNSADFRFIDAIEVIKSEKTSPQTDISLTPSEDIIPTGNIIPTDIIEGWGGYSSNQISDSELLAFAGITGEKIPSWFKQSNIAKWLLEDTITNQEFVNALQFLAKEGLLT